MVLEPIAKKKNKESMIKLTRDDSLAELFYKQPELNRDDSVRSIDYRDTDNMSAIANEND